jgi:hypothetical protein
MPQKHEYGFIIGKVHEKDNPNQWLVDFGEATIASIMTKKPLSPYISTIEMFVYGKETFDIILHLSQFIRDDQMHKLSYFGFYRMPEYTSDMLILVINSKLYTFHLANEILRYKTRFYETFQKNIYYKNKQVGSFYKKYPRTP